MQKLNDFLSVILKSFGVVVIAIGGIWLVISIWGNIVIARQNAVVQPPSVTSAPYRVSISSTHQVIYAKRYTTVDKEVYVLNGYYSINMGKWKFYSVPLTIDTYYWGPVSIVPR